MPSLLELLNKRKKENWTASHLGKILEDVEKLSLDELMGVSIGENDSKKLKQKYMILSRLLHPDKNVNQTYTKAAEALFKLMENAYTTLNDPEKRAAYHQSQYMNACSFNMIKLFNGFYSSVQHFFEKPNSQAPSNDNRDYFDPFSF